MASCRSSVHGEQRIDSLATSLTAAFVDGKMPSDVKEGIPTATDTGSGTGANQTGGANAGAGGTGTGDDTSGSERAARSSLVSGTALLLFTLVLYTLST